MLDITFSKKTIRGTLARQMLRLTKALVIKNPIVSEANFGKLYSTSLSPDFKFPKTIESQWIHYKTATMEWIRNPKIPCRNVILQLHGGAYVKSLNDTYRRSAIRYLKVSHGANVFSLDYRVAPAHPFPAALEDALAAYEYLLQSGYESNRIIVVGGSFGPRKGASFLEISKVTDLVGRG